MAGLADLAALAASGDIEVSPDRRFAGEILGIKDIDKALGATINQPRVNYFAGHYNERGWRDLMDNMHQGVRSGMLNASDVQTMLRLDDEQEARDFVNYSLKNNITRHEAIGVPHAFASENAYRAMLNANEGMSADFNNLGDSKATDLIVDINGRDKLIDVQNRTIGDMDPDKLSLGYRHSLPSGLGLGVFEKASNTSSIDSIVNKIDNLNRRDVREDKLGLDPRPGYGKDYLIGGMYKKGDVRNLIRDRNGESKGGYDFVRPRGVDLIDMNRLRSEFGRLNKNDLRAENVRLIPDRGKLKFGIPMDLISDLGANKTDMIDPRLLQRVRRL